VSPFPTAFNAMEYLGVPGPVKQSIWRDAAVDPDALRQLIVAVANKLEALEHRLAAAERERRD